MRKQFSCICMILLVATHFFAQSADPVILSYQRNFIRASISTKLELLNDASRVATVNMTPLYLDALIFAKQNYPVLGNDSQLLDIAVAAASKISSYADPSAITALEDIFSLIPDSRVRVACIESIAALPGDSSKRAGFLNAWLEANIAAQKGVPAAETKTLTACASALGKIADISSFEVLFKAINSAADTSVVSASIQAINSIQTGYADNILAKMTTENLQDTGAAFALAMKNENLAVSDRGKIAETAFTVASTAKMDTTDADAPRQQTLLKDSMNELKKLNWSQAASAVTKYFYIQQSNYKNGETGIENLIPVITCMGAMQSSEAAQALSIFLGLLNSETEQKKTCNEQLMLAVIQALGDLGDKTAFDYLLYIGYLDYPESVKKASRDALARLEW